MQKSFSFIDDFFKIKNRDNMMSITTVGFSITPTVVNSLMNKNKIFFTYSVYDIDTLYYTDIIIETQNIFLYFSRTINEPTFLLKILHKNNTEELKIFLKGLKQINKI